MWEGGGRRRRGVCVCVLGARFQCSFPQSLLKGECEMEWGREGLVDRGHCAQTTPWLPTGLLASVCSLCVHPQLHFCTLFLTHL